MDDEHETGLRERAPLPLTLRGGALRAPHVRRMAGQAVRFGVAGATVALTYVGFTLLLSGPGGLPIQAAIPVAYVLAVCLHFVLQRVFVFRHADEFTLSTGEQVRRYVVIGLIQYALTASATALLPGVLDVSEQLVYVGTVAVLSACTFLVLRRRVFHAS